MLAPRRRRQGSASREAAGGTSPTPILDWESDAVREFASALAADPIRESRLFLRAAHQGVAHQILPSYALNDHQPTSVTIARQRGSCSQRLAVVEALARRAGIATRVRGLAVDGAFWYPRFPRLGWLVPERIILAWPEFQIAEEWVSASELFGSMGELAACTAGFTNTEGETLFDAIARTAVDWDGSSGTTTCDLSATVREDLGYFDSRDELFAAQGQTLCWFARAVGDPIMSRRAAKR